MKPDSESKRLAAVGSQCRTGLATRALSFLSLVSFLSFLYSPATVVAEPAQAVSDGEVLVMAACQKAQQLMGEGKNVDARQLLEKACRYDPNSYSSTVHELLAESWQNVGNLDSAIKEYRRALEFEPGLLSATWNLCLALKDAGRTDEAKVFAGKFLALHPPAEYRAQAQRFIQDLEGRAASSSSRSQQPAQSGQPAANDYLELLAARGQLHRWERTSLPLSIYLSAEGLSKSEHSEKVQLFTSCMEAWVKASGGRLSYRITSDANKANVRISWTKDRHAVATTSGAIVEQGVARTHLKPDGKGGVVIDRAEVTFLTVNPTTGEPLSDDVRKSTCLHEIGHMLGLNGHSDNPSDIMFYSQSSKQLPALDRRDKTTIMRLYADYPATTGGSR